MTTLAILMTEYRKHARIEGTDERKADFDPYQLHIDEDDLVIFCQQISHNIVIHSALMTLEPEDNDPQALANMQTMLKRNFAYQQKHASMLAYDERKKSLVLYQQMPLSDVNGWQFTEAMEAFCANASFWKRVVTSL